jgi:small-conductance mechanosensitive channel
LRLPQPCFPGSRIGQLDHPLRIDSWRMRSVHTCVSVLAYRYGFVLQLKLMYIVAIAWIYVVLMMSITERSVIAGIVTFMFYGVLPLSIILYVMGTPQRRRMRKEAENLRRKQMPSEADASEN